MSQNTSTLSRLLEHPRYEVLPTAGIAEQIAEHVPADVTITVTASESLGLEATLSVCEQLRADGRAAVPHIAARMVRDRAQLREVAARMTDAGVRDVFVPGGDATPPAGDYASAVDLLRDLREIGAFFEDIGIAGYPEAHPGIEPGPLASALREKQHYATYIVSNMCFDPQVILRWIQGIRADGVDLPIQLGVPGRVELTKLTRIATRIGVGESVKFLMKNASTFARMAALGGYDPRKLLDPLTTLLEASAEPVQSLHMFTFNQVKATEEWRQRQLPRR